MKWSDTRPVVADDLGGWHESRRKSYGRMKKTSAVEGIGLGWPYTGHLAPNYLGVTQCSSHHLLHTSLVSSSSLTCPRLALSLLGSQSLHLCLLAPGTVPAHLLPLRVLLGTGYLFQLSCQPPRSSATTSHCVSDHFIPYALHRTHLQRSATLPSPTSRWYTPLLLRVLGTGYLFQLSYRPLPSPTSQGALPCF